MEVVYRKEVIEENQNLTDEEVVERVKAGELFLFEILMRRYNQRLFRIARSILRNDGEAEDVMQDAYVRAYSHLEQFEGRSKFSTWLTRIAVYESLARKRVASRFLKPNEREEWEKGMERFESKTDNPENQILKQEIGKIMESAIDSLPGKYRVVFVLRQIEGMSTQEAARSLDIGEEAVKSRLFRARAMLQQEIHSRTIGITSSLFRFGAGRCDSVVAAVLEKINRLKAKESGC